MSPTRLHEGTVHAHSTNSYDGTMSYPQLREFFHARGFAFVCMTEHIEELGQADIDRIVVDCRRHSDERFLFVPGIEMDCFVIYFLGIDHVQVDFASNQTIFDSLARVASMCVLSHPVKAGFEYPEWVRHRCDAVEVLNTKHDGHHYFRPESEELHRSIARDRSDVVRLAGMDFHSPKEWCDVRLRLSREGPLTEAFVLGELRAGAFKVLKGARAMDDYGVVERTLARGRTRIMDVAHGVHRTMTRNGIRVPSPLKRRLRRFLEGR